MEMGSWRSAAGRVGGMFALTACLLALGGCTRESAPPSTPARPAKPAPLPRSDLGADEKATIEIFRRAQESVVNISTAAVRQNRFNLDVTAIPAGTGSGFVWDTLGHVVTNFHVIREANLAQVTLADGTAFSAQLVGTAPDKDLAVLKIAAPADKLHPIPRGGSSLLQVGQDVLAIGNPFGLDHTLTKGIISGLGREIRSLTGRPITDVIQTDAAINPGNSGGPLLDSAGNLIGVNTAIVSPNSGTYAGIGFAVPVDTVNRFVPQLIEHGKVVRPGIGAAVAPDAIARRLRLPGVLVLEVASDSAAGRAGIRPTMQDDDGDVVLGDVIVGVDGDEVKSNDDLYRTLDRHEVGDEVSVTVLRDDRRVDIKVQLQAIP